MNKTYLFLILLISSFSLSAQDSSQTWHFSVGLDMGVASTYKITGTDTGFSNSLSMSPSISISHKSGLAFSYSPRFVFGGATQGLYMHAVSVGISQYDKPAFSYAANFYHYFFTGNKSIPYSPLTNELYTSFMYKKPWLRPGISAGIGFGTNTSVSPSAFVYDMGISAGVSHSFDWDSGDVSFSAAPSLSLNAGTNDYFSFLNTTKYIGKGSNSGKYIKKGAGSNSGRGRSSSSGTTTTTTATQGKTFDLTNIELGIESSMEIGAFTMRPELSFYLPVGSTAGSGISTYWQIAFQYKF